MNEKIRQSVAARGIQRLCHFTPSRNLMHIAAGHVGILSTSALQAAERTSFNPTDLQRLDNRQTHICCSIEYPNAWYFDRARAQENLFPDWVVLLIDPKYLWQDGTLFSPRNAAAEYGRHITSGLAGFEAMYANEVVGTRNTVYRRTAQQSPACPTDQQAEVLIQDRILMRDILGVAVKNDEQGLTERARLKANGLDPDMFRFIAAPHMFNKYDLDRAIKSGVQPSENLVTPPRKEAGEA
jgi:ssDNA thymidine ADP-ribosyltransferase, DarT